MRVAELMTKRVETVHAAMPAFQAWDLMRRRRIRHLVVTENAEIVGVLSVQDAGGRLGSNLRANASVGDMMTHTVETVGPEMTVRQAANKMRGRSIGCLPVVDEGKLIGIVTTADLLEMLGRGVDRPRPAQRRGLHHRVPHRHVSGATGMW